MQCVSQYSMLRLDALHVLFEIRCTFYCKQNSVAEPVHFYWLRPQILFFGSGSSLYKSRLKSGKTRFSYVFSLVPAPTKDTGSVLLRLRLRLRDTAQDNAICRTVNVTCIYIHCIQSNLFLKCSVLYCKRNSVGCFEE